MRMNPQSEYKDEQRTLQQNKAMYKFFEMVSDEAKSSGITFSEFIKMRPRLDMHWTPTRVKELWKEIQFLLYRTESTADLTKKQIDEVYDVFNKATSEIMGFSIPFPSQEELSMQELADEFGGKIIK
jgi:hypothetical protein